VSCPTSVVWPHRSNIPNSADSPIGASMGFLPGLRGLERSASTFDCELKLWYGGAQTAPVPGITSDPHLT
jgi:hypothetical protein